MSRSIYLAFDTTSALLSLEELSCPPEAYSVKLDLTPDCTKLALLTIQRPSCQLSFQLSLLGLEECLPRGDCPLRRQVDLINNCLTSYQKKVACECFPGSGTNRLFNAFMMGLSTVLVVHGLCLSGYGPFSRVKLSGSLIQSVTRANACSFLCNVGSALDPCDTKLVYGYRNFWRVWAGCFDRSSSDVVLDELAAWMNGADDSSVDCSEVFVDEEVVDILEPPAFIEESPDQNVLGRDSPQREHHFDVNTLLSEIDQYHSLSGHGIYEDRLSRLERLIDDVNANLLDLEAKVERVSSCNEDCDDRLTKVERRLQSSEECSEECKQSVSDDRLATVERQLAVYSKLLKELSLKVCQ